LRITLLEATWYQQRQTTRDQRTKLTAAQTTHKETTAPTDQQKTVNTESETKPTGNAKPNHKPTTHSHGQTNERKPPHTAPTAHHATQKRP